MKNGWIEQVEFCAGKRGILSLIEAKNNVK